MSSYLPSDLIEEILSRVPATSLKRLRSTCKVWNTLFKDQRFSEKHFRNSPKESLHIMLKEYRFCSISVNNLNGVPDPSIEFKDGHDLEVDIAQVSNCDGLLLCRTMDQRLVVWNPCLGETRWIKSIPDSITKSSTFALGYKNDKSCRNYKILRGWHYRDRVDVPGNFGSEIYEFSSNSWRVIDDKITSCFIHSYGDVCLKGNIYWLGSNLEEETLGRLICFDFTTERSKRLCIPVSKNLNPSFRGLSVFREEQLSLLYVNTTSSKMEIWVTNNKEVDNEADLSWRKSFAVNLFPSFETETDSILTNLIIDEEKRVALSIITYWGEKFSSRLNMVWLIVGDKLYFKQVPGTESSQSPQYNLYVPSLLQIH